MKLKEKQEIINKEKPELVKQLADLRKKLTAAVLEHKQFKLKNTSSLRNMRREIAVVMTVLNMKEEQNGKNA